MIFWKSERERLDEDDDDGEVAVVSGRMARRMRTVLVIVDVGVVVSGLVSLVVEYNRRAGRRDGGRILISRYWLC